MLDAEEEKAVAVLVVDLLRWMLMRSFVSLLKTSLYLWDAMEEMSSLHAVVPIWQSLTNICEILKR